MRVLFFIIVYVSGNHFYNKGDYYNAAIFGAMAITFFVWAAYDRARKEINDAKESE